MTKLKEHREVIKLRKQGRSYSQIRKRIKLSKSTLTRWLSTMPLNKEQISKLRDRNPERIEKFRNTMKRKRDMRLAMVYIMQKKKTIPLNKKELYYAGLFLYWGEGNKSNRHTISISNTDPAVLCFMLYWYIKILGFSKNKIKIYLHLYQDMNIQDEIRYWSKILHLNISHFTKPYIKSSMKKNIDQKGFGHGTCTLVVQNTREKEKIMMSIKAIGDHYGQKVIEI